VAALFAKISKTMKRRIKNKVLLSYPKDVDIDIAVVAMDEINTMVDKLQQVIVYSDGQIDGLIDEILYEFEPHNGILFFSQGVGVHFRPRKTVIFLSQMCIVCYGV
jgi:hypothetical protein